MKSLKKLKEEILSDGIIDEAEVKELEKVLYADGLIDLEEADFLFELNNAVSGKDNHSSWEQLFIRSISNHLLEDEKSPGEIDDSEANWLYNKIKGDGKIDSLEMKLLNHLKENSKSFPSNLQSLLHY